MLLVTRRSWVTLDAEGAGSCGSRLVMCVACLVVPIDRSGDPCCFGYAVVCPRMVRNGVGCLGGVDFGYLGSRSVDALDSEPLMLGPFLNREESLLHLPLCALLLA